MLTGFEAFGGQPINPSALAVTELAGEMIANCRVETRVLPCTFDGAIAMLDEEIRSLSPALVICVGQASGSDSIAVERIAINLDDASSPDNLGCQPRDTPICEEGPAAYWGTLPTRRIVDALTREGIKARLSQDAGTFVCNHVFYGLMRIVEQRREVRAGFIHVPLLPEQVAENQLPSMSLSTIVRAIAIACAVSLQEGEIP